ncbi:MAG: hypothetical protein QM784_10680 [Polyangiaceae bacterium]
MLKAAGAIPSVLAYHSGIGYAAESDAPQLLAIDTDGTPFLVRRTSGRPAPDSVESWKDVNLYEPVAPHYAPAAADDESFEFEKLFVELPTVNTYLAFTNPAAVHLGSISKAAIPKGIIARDMELQANETLDTSYCMRSPSGHCLAVYRTTGPDEREARLLVTLYDSGWMRIGFTERDSRLRLLNYEGWLRPLAIEAIFNITGMDAPVFVTREFAARCPCTEFQLNTFVAGEKFATLRIRNDAVVDMPDGGVCLCTV